MGQYDGLVIKSGIPTIIGVDTLRADRGAPAGLTTTGLASGDACQVSGALTLQKAVNTSTSPVIGIYDGVTGSVVREGVVVATFKSGPTTAGEAVYLSSTAGQLTNVKPTKDMIHEVGVVVDVPSKKVLLQQKPVIALPASPPASIYQSGFSRTVLKTKLSDGTPTWYTIPASGSGGNDYSPGWFDGTYIWFAYGDFSTGSKVCKINCETGAITEYSTSLGLPTISFDGTYIWVANELNAGEIQKWDLNGNVLDSWGSGHPGMTAIFSDRTGYLWVAVTSYGYQKVQRIRISDHAVMSTWEPLLSAPAGFCLAGANLWIGCDSHVYKVRVSDGTQLGNWSNGRNRGYWPTFDGTRIWQPSTRGFLHRWTEADGTDLGEIGVSSWDYGPKSVAYVDPYLWFYVGNSAHNPYATLYYTLGGAYVGGYNGSSQAYWTCANKPLVI